MIRTAVLGCGRIGAMHAANIAAHSRAGLAGVYHINAAAAEAVATKTAAKVFASAEAVYSAADVDAVLIATATDTHADLLELAVAAGKPVLCEKPIDLSLARFILSEEVTEVFATGSRPDDPALTGKLGDHDTVAVVLKTASGKQAIATTSRRATSGCDRRVEALGTTGMAISENRRPHEMTLHTADFTDRAEPLLNFFIEPHREAFDAEISEFVEAIKETRAPSVGFEDGRLPQAKAALKSITEGRVVAVKEMI